MTGWFVIKTQHQREPWACENLIRQGAEPYLPRIVQRVRSELCTRCLFPSYVFVRTPNGQWRFLSGTYGVLSVIMFGEQPANVPDSEIQKIKAREVDGVVVLPTTPYGPNRFKRNATVRANAGTFSGFVGLYQGIAPQRRQKVLMDFLGRKTTVLIPDADLEEV